MTKTTNKTGSKYTQVQNVYFMLFHILLVDIRIIMNMANAININVSIDQPYTTIDRMQARL